MKEENPLIEINGRFIKTDFCNSYIKSTFSTYLLMLDYRKLDLHDMFILNNNSCFFEMSSKDDNHLKLAFEFWSSQVNIYLGEKQVHYADDVDVRNENEQLKFQKELHILFYGSVDEEVSVNNYNLQFKNSAGETIKKFRSNIKNAYLLNGKDPFKKKYRPWLS